MVAGNQSSIEPALRIQNYLRGLAQFLTNLLDVSEREVHSIIHYVLTRQFEANFIQRLLLQLHLASIHSTYVPEAGWKQNDAVLLPVCPQHSLSGFPVMPSSTLNIHSAGLNMDLGTLVRMC